MGEQGGEGLKGRGGGVGMERVSKRRSVGVGDGVREVHAGCRGGLGEVCSVPRPSFGRLQGGNSSSW